MTEDGIVVGFGSLARSAEATAEAIRQFGNAAENFAHTIAGDFARELREYEIAVQVSLQFMGRDRRLIKREVRKAIERDRKERMK